MPVNEKIVKEILNKKFVNYDLIEYNINEITTNGTLGQYFNLECKVLVNNEEITETFFIKKRAECDAATENFMVSFQKEATFYKTLEKMQLDKLVENVAPKCFLILPDDTLIMENLICQGFCSLNPQEEISVDMIKAVLKSLAALHAVSILYEEKRSKELNRKFSIAEDNPNLLKEIYFDLLNPINRKMMQAVINGTKTAMEKFEVIINKSPVYIEEYLNEMFELVKPSCKFRNVISHSDLWTANMFVKFEKQEPISVKLIDYQFVRYSPPSRDVMFLIYVNMLKELREKHLMEILEFYYECFANILKENGLIANEVLPFKEFIESCEEEKRFATCCAFIWLPTTLIELKEFHKILVPEVLERVFFNNKYSVLDDVNRSKYFDQRLKDALIDLKNLIEKS